MRLQSKVDIEDLKKKFNETKSYAKTAEWASKTYDLHIQGSHVRYWLSKPEKKEQKILLFDIETAPMLVYTWGLYNQNISHSAIKEDWYVLMWAAKWLEGSIMYDALSNYEFVDREDKEFCVISTLWDLLDKADIVVAHNGKNFDVKKMNAKFLEHGLGQPSYYKVVDTYEIARSNFGLTSNKLDYIAQTLNFGGKDKTDFSLWLGCMENDPESWDTMIEYCKRDVELLEQVYKQLRAWDKKHPAVILSNEMRCNACGGTDLNYVTDYHTAASTFEVYQCECGHQQRSRINVANDEERKNRSVNV